MGKALVPENVKQLSSDGPQNQIKQCIYTEKESIPPQFLLEKPLEDLLRIISLRTSITS